MAKRLADLLIALVLALPACTVVAFAAVVIRMDSPGPAIFRQIRVGRDQRPFTLYKLRTMQLGTGDRASHEATKAHITRIGALLRRTKIDELPQILSVLRGDMSFVGPRPCLPSQFELIRERAARGVFMARPGITGSAQLAGVDMSTPVRLAEIDGEYVAHLSLARDLALIVRTAMGRGGGDAIGR